MKDPPRRVAEFLQCKVVAVVGVSRNANQPANAIFRKMKSSGFTVFPVNPNIGEVEGVACYPDVFSPPLKIQGAVVVTHPDKTAEVVRQCVAAGIDQIWIHRSFGQGSVSEEAVRVCERENVNCLVGGCPMMYCKPVDLGHKCMRWMLGLRHRLPT